MSRQADAAPDDADDFMDLLGPEVARLRDQTTPMPFGSTAIVTAEFQLPPDEALRYSVEQPNARHALSPVKVQRITANQIRYGFMQLLHRNEENAQKWLEQVAAVNPKTAIELLIEIAQFVTPKLKAVAIATKDETDPLKAAAADRYRAMPTEQLLAELAGKDT